MNRTDRIDEVHLWHIGLDELPPSAVRRFEAALGPDELARRATHPHARNRVRYTAAHGALRILLGHILNVAAHDLRIRRGPMGKPELTGQATSVRFSLSHAQGHAVAAVSAGRAIGVDLDYPRSEFPLEAFTRRYFPPPERDLVLSAPHNERPLMFLKLWTRKEALVKAAGARMALGVRQHVGATADTAVVLGTHSRLRGTWNIQNLPPPAGGAAAVALADDRPYRVVTHDWVTDAP